MASRELIAAALITMRITKGQMMPTVRQCLLRERRSEGKHDCVQ